jgi:hypothetical protein
MCVVMMRLGETKKKTKKTSSMVAILDVPVGLCPKNVDILAHYLETEGHDEQARCSS